MVHMFVFILMLNLTLLLYFSICLLNKSKHLSCQNHRNTGHCSIRPFSVSTSLSNSNSVVDEFTQKQHASFIVSSRIFLPLSLSATFPCSSLFLSKANSTSTGQLDKLGSQGLPALTPDSEEERSLPPQRVSTFRPRPYSMADSNKVSNTKPVGGG